MSLPARMSRNIALITTSDGTKVRDQLESTRDRLRLQQKESAWSTILVHSFRSRLYSVFASDLPSPISRHNTLAQSM